MTSSLMALSLFVALAVASACGGDGAAPAPTGPGTATATSEATASSTATSTPAPLPAGNPIGTPTPLPIAVADDAVWREVAAMTAGHLAPLLRPRTLPAGLETVESSYWFRGKPPDHSAFSVDYRGPERRLRLMAGMLNPPPPSRTGHQERVLLRGREATLTINDDTDPSRAAWVSWEEPGLWKPDGEPSGAAWVRYEVAVEGISPRDLLAFVEALQPWLPE